MVQNVIQELVNVLINFIERENMRRIVFVISILTVLMMGCGNGKNLETEKGGNVETEMETNLAELYDWDHAMIKSVDDYPNFGTGSVIQDEKYIFYPKDGNKVIRVEKNSKDEKIIYEFAPSKKEGIGVHFCLGENNIFFEYEGNIFSSDYDGSKAVKIISNSKLKEMISRDTANIEDSCEISAIYFYNQNIYFFSRMKIYEYNLDTKKITLLGESSGSACFCKNALYYESYGSTVIYKVNLSTLERKRVRGKETAVSQVQNSNTIKYYKAVMEVDNQLYYVRIQNGIRPVIYQYCKDGEDKEIYEYAVQPEQVIGICSDSGKVVCTYHTDSTKEHSKFLLYDIKTSVLKETDVPNDCFAFDFIIGDMIFYLKDYSDYLSFVCYE